MFKNLPVPVPVEAIETPIIEPIPAGASQKLPTAITDFSDTRLETPTPQVEALLELIVRLQDTVSTLSARVSSLEKILRTIQKQK